jgi:3,4-dihydroxy 2-butanone 4-phosphate synthase/GTP cyclohydrolase II
MAQPGGVLTRAGHTEAGCDLARLAGRAPAAVIVEILNDDGTMARRGDLETFADRHGLKIGTIADLIRYRLEKERSIECIYERVVTTEFGQFRLRAYEDHVHRAVHLALVRGEFDESVTPLVRVHVMDTMRDTLGVQTEPSGWTLRSALERIAAEEHGVVILLRWDESPADLIDAIQAIGRPKSRRTSGPVLRTYGIGAQILRDLGISRMRVLSAPKQMHGLAAFGLEVTSYVDAPVKTLRAVTGVKS